jgi:glutathione reductase (NADPH)
MYYAMLEKKGPTAYKLVCEGPNGTYILKGKLMAERVVGLHIIGVGSAEILQGFGVAIKMGATKANFGSFRFSIILIQIPALQSILQVQKN